MISVRGPELAASTPQSSGSLCCQRPAWLALAHDKLDAAVFAAYGCDPSMTDEQVLESLLVLNLVRAGAAK